MRFIAVAQPLHARRHPVLRFSRTIICAVFVVSALLTLPYFLLLKVQRHVPVSSLVSSHLPNPTLPPPPYASPPSLPTLAAHHYPAATAHRRPNDISADFKRITRPSWRANSSQHGSDMTVTIGDTALDQLLVGDFYEIVAFFGKNSSATRNLKVHLVLFYRMIWLNDLIRLLALFTARLYGIVFNVLLTDFSVQMFRYIPIQMWCGSVRRWA